MPRSGPSLRYERAFWRDGFLRVAGLDEVGRGALAGPVVAAAVILPAMQGSGNWKNTALFHAIERAKDSKLLTERAREALFDPLRETALAYGVGIASTAEVDALNVLRASRVAMHRALEALALAPDALLLDALVLSEIPVPQQGIIHGDALALSIAAASIVAKVTRDRLMRELDPTYPVYGFARHKGYGTAAHLAALREHGPSPIHRRSFAPLQLLDLDI